MKAHDFATRSEIIRRHEDQQSAISISHSLKVSYSSVRQVIKRYRQAGEAGLATGYARCGRRATYSPQVLDLALGMKRQHPAWGAPYILLRLREALPSAALPGARRLQQVFRQQALHPHRTSRRCGSGRWAAQPLECVQVDAKERLVTADGRSCCYLNFVDEFTGSELDAFVFPLCAHQ